MNYVHACGMCGWDRPAASPTVTSPRCENCGCALESTRVSDLPAPERLAQGIALPEPVRAALARAAAIAGIAILMLAAARTGYSAGGPAIAVSAVGVAGLLVVMAMTAERA